MRVVLSTYGSRGDVEPMVALAVALRALGAQVRVCTPPDEDFVGLLARVGVPLVPAGQSVREMVRQVRTGGTPPYPLRTWPPECSPGSSTQSPPRRPTDVTRSWRAA